MKSQEESISMIGMLKDLLLKVRELCQIDTRRGEIGLTLIIRIFLQLNAVVWSEINYILL